MNFCLRCHAVLPERLPGQKGRKQLYCSKLCNMIYKGYVANKPRSSHCWFCNSPLPNIMKAGFPQRYCDRKCASKYRVAFVKRKKPRVAKNCLYCLKGFETPIDSQKFCSQDCRKIFDAKAKALFIRLNKPEFYEYRCDRCDVSVRREHSVTRGKYGRFCDECRLINKRARYHVKTVKRQSLLVKPSRLSCDEIAERDKYICHICKELVDMTLPRTRGLGATVDHVIPLSKGGSDLPENLRLAHWVCNNRKSDKIYA